MADLEERELKRKAWWDGIHELNRYALKRGVPLWGVSVRGCVPGITGSGFVVAVVLPFPALLFVCSPE